MGVPIIVEYSEDGKNKINEEELQAKDGYISFVEIRDVINYIADEDEYPNDIENDDFIRNLINEEKRWFSTDEYNIFKKSFMESVKNYSLNNNTNVYIKRTNEIIKFAFINVNQFKRGFLGIKKKPEFEKVYFSNEKKRKVFCFFPHRRDLTKYDFDEFQYSFYRAVQRIKGDDRDHGPGEAIDVEIRSIDNSSEYEFDIKQLNQVADFANRNNYKMQILFPEE